MHGSLCTVSCVRCEKDAYKHEVVPVGCTLLLRIVRDMRYPSKLDLYFNYLYLFFEINYWQIIAPLDATVSRGEGEASDGGELQKG